MTNLAVETYFSAAAPSYDRRSRLGIWRWQRAREAAAVFAALGDCRGESALDLGCGAGYYTRELLARGARHVTAVDISPAMLGQLPTSMVTPVLGDAEQVRLGRRFRLIVIAGVLEFCPHADTVVFNAANHLPPGGRIALLAPRANSAGVIYRHFHRRHGIAVRLFTRDEIWALARQSNLRILSQRMVAPFTSVYGMGAVDK